MCISAGTPLQPSDKIEHMLLPWSYSVANLLNEPLALGFRLSVWLSRATLVLPGPRVGFTHQKSTSAHAAWPIRACENPDD